MEFAYVQAGQENSFTWKEMAKGYEIQMPLIAKLRDEHKLQVETLAASGEWFRKKYKLTPATSVTVTEDVPGSDKKTVWFNSRYYRFNVLWENNTMRFRDIHLFNEDFPSYYTKNVASSNECSFFTLPFVDGYRWSTVQKKAGLRLKAIKGGKEILVEGSDPIVNDNVPGQLHVEWPLTSFSGKLVINVSERQLKLLMHTDEKIDWFLEFSAADGVVLPFTKISPHVIDCRFEKMDYKVKAMKGVFSKSETKGEIRIKAKGPELVLDFTSIK